MDDIFADGSSDSLITYREKYRKISGSSIISPFEYSLSIDDAYTLKLSYRLNERNYFERKIRIDYVGDTRDADGNYVYNILEYGLGDYAGILEQNLVPALKIYYFDLYGEMCFLDEAAYSVDLDNNKITLITNENLVYPAVNPITTPNGIRNFWISFNPEFNDVEYDSYEFTYDPTKNLE
ncbi:unnamed protein product, partial [marine sediment metagenome]